MLILVNYWLPKEWGGKDSELTSELKEECSDH